MFQRFVSHLFGNKRAQSEEPVSKKKPQFQTQACPRRINSIGSKVNIDTIIKNPPKPQSFFDDKDEIQTVKKSGSSIMLQNKKDPSLNYECVSDISDEPVDLLAQILTQIHQKPLGQGSINFSQNNLKCNNGQNILKQLQEEEKIQKKRKDGLKDILFKKDLVNKKLNPKIECALCKKALQISESFQLACSHRCHKDCSIKMRVRNRYQCDKCEIKKRNQISMGMMDKRRGISPIPK